MKNWWKDVFLAVWHSLKLQWKGKNTPVILCLGLVLMTGMLLEMDEVKEEKSRIVIGMVDEDQSYLSEKLRQETGNLDLYKVVDGLEKELIAMLRANELSAVCVIPKGYESSVMEGKERNLVTIYESSRSEALLVGDILAGILMQDICVAKGYLTLEEYCEKNTVENELSFQEYREYTEELLKEEGMNFRFDVEYISVEGEQVERPAQSLVYTQGILAVFALITGVLAMYAVLPFQQMLHGEMKKKLLTLPVLRGAYAVGTAAAAFVLPVMFSVLFLGIFSTRQGFFAEQTFSLLVCTGGYVCGIVCIMLVLSCLISNKTVYQTGMLVMLFVFGIAGLVSVVEGVFIPEGMTAWIPNSRFVRQVTELLSYKG